MPRTNTKTRSQFSRPGIVTYNLPNPPYSTPITEITLSENSTWTSSLHWHEKHTEYLQIMSGTALITLYTTTREYTASDGVIVIQPFAKHEWRRAFPDGGDVVVREWTYPEDGMKEVFFRNLGSVIDDFGRERERGEGKGRCWLMWQLWVVFWGADNWPALVDFGWIPLFGRALECLVVHVALRAAVMVGWVFGLKSVYEEYTPDLVLRTEGETEVEPLL